VGYWKNLLGRSAGTWKSGLGGPEGPQALFRGRVLPFDESAALIWGHLMAAGNSTGRPRSALDTVIAAIAQSNNCVLVTDNERHFPGVELLNPIRGTG
jgi:toxin FitB